MDIHQILNNNVITTLDAEGQEFIAMGKGLAFSKKKGDTINPDDIEKFFVAKDYRGVESPYISNDELPNEYLVVIEGIMQKAKSVLGDELSINLSLTLGEHIYRVLEQYAEGNHQANILNSEIRRFYPKEYAIGVFALEQIEKELKVKLPEDEAGFIALHLFAGQMNGDFHITQKMTVIIKEILTIIRQTLNISEDVESLNRFSFMTQLKYLSYKVLNGIIYEVNDEDHLFSIPSKDNPEVFESVGKIRDYLLEDYRYKMSTEDEFYLVVHLIKLVNENAHE